MKQNKTNYLEKLGYVLFFLAVVTLVVHLFRITSTMSQTETTLFGILQFVFSIAFAWILSRASCKKEFEENQRNFAIAAYRRILEIEQGILRIRERISIEKSKCANELYYKELELIEEIARRIQSTTRSSISDWSDIIGDEIATIEEMEKIQSQRDDIKRDPVNINEALESIKKSTKEIERLREKLPISLRTTETELEKEKFEKAMVLRLIHNELLDYKSLVLLGFWSPEPEFKFDADIRIYSPQSQFFIERCGIDNGNGPLALRTSDGKLVGRMTNKYLASSYDIFASLLCEVIGSNKFPVILESVETREGPGGRIYFKVRYLPMEMEKDRS